MVASHPSRSTNVHYWNPYIRRRLHYFAVTFSVGWQFVTRLSEKLVVFAYSVAELELH